MEYGNSKVPQNFKYKNFNLGAWVSTQRQTKDKIDSEKIKKLESLYGWVWNPLEDKWNEGFEYLKKYVEEYAHAKVPAQYKYGSFNLGVWVRRQRENKSKLSLEKIERLELLNGWDWTVKSE